VFGMDALIEQLKRDHPFLPHDHAARIAHAYGRRAKTMLGGAASLADLGISFGASLSEREVRYLMDNEWAETADDVVWRRSKLGLQMSSAEVAALDRFMREARSARKAQSSAAVVSG
jgi:glycerol-3-phosphate dehydrogenase